MRIRALPLGTFLLAAWAGPVAAQLISIRTVPISQSHQFDLFPSTRMGMGGVSLAVTDSLYDPFGNPAKGVRLGASRFFGSPGVYSVSQGAGAGRTLPVGTWVRSGNWFGGASVALQEMDLSDANPFQPFPPSCPQCDVAQILQVQGVQLPSADRSHNNAFGYAMLGMAVPHKGLSFGASVLWSGLHGVDGVDLLYPRSTRLTQKGHDVDLRLGALKEWGSGRSLSAVVVHNRFAASHDVFYFDSFWDPGAQQFSQRPRLEENLDQTNTWGAHLEYSLPLRAPGWRVGWAVAPEDLSVGIRRAHDFVTVGAPHPLQEAAITALGLPDAYYVELREGYRRRRDLLLGYLEQAGFVAWKPRGAYYILTDVAHFMKALGLQDDTAFAMWLVKELGVATVPGSSFYAHPELGRTKIRFCFPKTEDVLREAGERLQTLRSLGV